MLLLQSLPVQRLQELNAIARRTSVGTFPAQHSNSPRRKRNRYSLPSRNCGWPGCCCPLNVSLRAGQRHESARQSLLKHGRPARMVWQCCRVSLPSRLRNTARFPRSPRPADTSARLSQSASASGTPTQDCSAGIRDTHDFRWQAGPQVEASMPLPRIWSPPRIPLWSNALLPTSRTPNRPNDPWLQSTYPCFRTSCPSRPKTRSI